MFYGPSRHTMRRHDSLARQHTHSVQALALAFLPGVTPLMDAVMHGQHAAVLAFMQAVRLYTTPSFDIAHLLCRVPHAKSHGIHSKTEARPAAVCGGCCHHTATGRPDISCTGHTLLARRRPRRPLRPTRSRSRCLCDARKRQRRAT